MQVAAAVDAWHVFYGRRYEPAMSETDQAVATALGAAGLQVHTFSGHLLQEPWRVQVSGTG
jgi:deoxyribodipyrimidine photo-lyase